MALSHDLCTIPFPPSLPPSCWLASLFLDGGDEEDDLGDSISEPFKATSAPRTALLMVSTRTKNPITNNRNRVTIAKTGVNQIQRKGLSDFGNSFC